jgi:hypothetical protein
VVTSAASSAESTQDRNRFRRQAPLGISELGKQVCAVVEVLKHIVVVDRLLDETVACDERINGRSGSVGLAEELVGNELAHD